MDCANFLSAWGSVDDWIFNLYKEVIYRRLFLWRLPCVSNTHPHTWRLGATSRWVSNRQRQLKSYSDVMPQKLTLNYSTLKINILSGVTSTVCLGIFVRWHIICYDCLHECAFAWMLSSHTSNKQYPFKPFPAIFLFYCDAKETGILGKGKLPVFSGCVFVDSCEWQLVWYCSILKMLSVTPILRQRKRQIQAKPQNINDAILHHQPYMDPHGRKKVWWLMATHAANYSISQNAP